MSNELSHKLHNYQAIPPAEIWEEIASALDHRTSSLVDKLYNYTQLPGESLWKDIEQELEGNTIIGTAVILPFYKRYRQPIKYSAAAAILVLLATAITLFLSRGKGINEVAVQHIPVGTTVQPTESTNQKNALLPKNLQSGVESKEGAGSVNHDSKVLSENQQGKQKGSRYVTMADEDGNKIRLSKKALTVFDCAGNTTSLNYKRCKENILLMQKKMSASLLSPSGDFGGLIEMIKSLEEND
jgi:hypothetical protein